ncbi:ATP-dependent helicase [Patescibacteria group bacterium]|nr:ATP-dependent helicase [Patescibacteria group bacterium]
MSNFEKKLNKEQQEAIKHKAGPLLIIAGAGTGKTTVITERIKYIILSKLAKPDEILALTFTEKAAREMEERVDVAMPYGYTQMWISTFHSFCDRILRREALHIGLDPKYKLMGEAETIQLIRNNLFKFDLDYFRPLGNPNKFIGGMLQHFSRLQDEDVSPIQYMDWVKKQKTKAKRKSKEEKLEITKWEELAKAYKAYDELKVKEGFMDYGDLIVKALKLFKERKNILRQYQEQFRYLLIDEFQDTNFAQNGLSVLLSGLKKNITVVGDDDQSIYRFRGAAVSNIIQFRKNFPRTKVIVLTKNYRSTQEILDKSYALIQHNNPDRLESVEKIDKHLVSQVAKDGEEIKFIHSDRVENEADSVAKKIQELIKEEDYEFRHFAILVRANNHAEPFVRAFQRHGIPSQFLGPGRLFKQPEVVDLISYLKVLYNFGDSVAFYRLLSIEYFDISARDLAMVGNYAKRLRLSLFEACEKVDDIFVSNETKEKVKKVIGVIDKHLKLVRKETAGQLLYYFLEDTGLLQKLLNPNSPDTEKRAANISKFFDRLKTYEVDHEDATIPAVVDWIELSSELGESPLAADTDWTDINAVNILTAHSAKGLEFPVVFLVNLVAQRFPTIERREQIPIPDALVKEILPVGDYHLEEERRLFYVGMTRAKDLLFFTAADYYGEGKREKRLSPFIFETLGDEVISSEQLTSNVKQLSFLDYAAPKIPDTRYEIPSLHVDYLSYSQIETFRTCPLHYKLKYIVKIPTPPSASQSFGISIHAAIKRFFDLVALGERANEKLIYKCLEGSWVKEGYLDKIHEKKFFEKGKIYLSGFLKEGFDPENLPEAMEQMFTVPIISKDKKQYLRVGGKIDRLDVFPDGSIEIIDYKTGASMPKQKELENNLQLSFYALAATSIPDKPFGRLPEKIKLTLYFLDQQQKFSTTRTKEDLEKAKEEIFKTKEEIEKSDFKCSGHMFCQNNCEYSLFCRVQE